MIQDGISEFCTSYTTATDQTSMAWSCSVTWFATSDCNHIALCKHKTPSVFKYLNIYILGCNSKTGS